MNLMIKRILVENRNYREEKETRKISFPKLLFAICDFVFVYSFTIQHSEDLIQLHSTRPTCDKESCGP